METLSIADLRRLAGYQGSYVVSVFLPTHRHFPDTQQDPIRYGNLLREIEESLTAQGWRSPTVREFMHPARALLDDAEFWRHQQDGLAVFLDADEFHAYRLPYPVEQRAMVCERHFLAPLLPLFTNNGHFFILALSQNQARLFEATRFSVGEIDIAPGAPTSLAAATGEIDHERGLSARTTGGGGAAFYSGSASGGEVERMRVSRFLNELDKGVAAALRDSGAPLVVAGVEWLLPVYREVSNYPAVVEKGPTGNPEALRPDEIHAQAWPFVEEQFRATLESALAAYRAQAGTGLTGAGLNEILPAALYGRVETLLLPTGLEAWGTLAGEPAEVTRTEEGAPGAVELAGLAAAHVLTTGGRLLAVEPDSLPDGAEAAAIFRY